MIFEPATPADYAAFSEEYAEYLRLTEPEPENLDNFCPDCKDGLLCRKHWNKMMVEKYG